MAKESAAQFYDRFLGRTTFGLFLLAFALVIDCIGYFVEPGTQDLLRYGRRALSVIIVLAIGPVVLKLLWMRWKDKSSCREPESFVVEIYKKASMHGFTFIALTLVALQGYLGTVESPLPAQFFIKAILAATLMVTSISFYLQMRVEEEDDDFEDTFDDEIRS